jgi:hypothetical protein
LTTNSIRFTEVAEYLLIEAKYRGARLTSSRRHPASATSTRRIPSEKLTACVRSATALPQVTCHASKALSSGGARCSASAIIDSRAADARFNGSLPAVAAIRSQRSEIRDQRNNCSIAEICIPPSHRSQRQNGGSDRTGRRRSFRALLCDLAEMCSRIQTPPASL